MTRILILLLTVIFLTGCSRSDAIRIARATVSGDPAAVAETLARDKAVQYASNPTSIKTDVQHVQKCVEDFVEAIRSIWGKDDIRVPRPKEYVKYTQNYLSRASVDFDTGNITVETLDNTAPLKSLHTAIVTTLLTPNDPRAVNLYSAETITLGDTPFLLGEVKDHKSQDIRWEWRASQFADRLIQTALKTRTISGKTAHFVTFHMVKDHLDVRARKYASLVTSTAKRFNVSKNLIFAIMKVESDFNPFALSSANAIGLMQVVPATAGSDVYRYLHGRKGQPSTKDLLGAQTNITYGAAYLHLLDTRFLKGVVNPVSREYCVIAGYNGGAGTVFRTFDKNTKKAAQTINRLSPGEIYTTLRTKTPYAETRRYLGKVLEAKKHFVNF
ncbi:membrane-bound lytic murein transglycosylase MltC [Pseudodesulfovibrio sp. JC047]|nr:membrane-bound lytic murein transglycosylase MltC [Pseudodesulfovibrio sp. JC047]